MDFRKDTLVLYDPDIEFVNAFCSYLQKNQSHMFDVVVYTDTHTLCLALSESAPSFLLCHETAMARPEVQKLQNVLFLKEFSKESENEIFKYQSCEQILLALCEKYSIPGVKMRLTETLNSCKILSVYSPVKRCGKTRISKELGILLASHHKTIFISAEQYAYGFPLQDSENDLSDLLYLMQNERMDSMRLGASVKTVLGLDYIRPPRNPEDVCQISAEELIKLFDFLKTTGYQRIVVDIGEHIKEISLLLNISNHIYMPRLQDDYSQYKINLFQDYYSDEFFSHLQEKLRLITMEAPVTDETSACLPDTRELTGWLRDDGLW